MISVEGTAVERFEGASIGGAGGPEALYAGRGATEGQIGTGGLWATLPGRNRGHPSLP